MQPSIDTYPVSPSDHVLLLTSLTISPFLCRHLNFKLFVTIVPSALMTFYLISLTRVLSLTRPVLLVRCSLLTTQLFTLFLIDTHHTFLSSLLTPLTSSPGSLHLSVFSAPSVVLLKTYGSVLELLNLSLLSKPSPINITNSYAIQKALFL